MEKFVIEGGHRLTGHLRPSGSKNEALPILAAVLLAEKPVTLRNLPMIADVRSMIEILKDLGVAVEEHDDPSVVTFDASSINSSTPNPEVCKNIRASILFAGPLLARMGEATLAPPGGDVIGRRRLDTHIHALGALGAAFEVEKDFFIRAPNGLQGTNIFLDEQSVTATENTIMAAALAKGLTVIENAACEPHVRGLCEFLNQLGANIQGAGTHILRIEGVSSLQGTDYTIGSDYLEIGSFIGLSAVSGGPLTIENVNPTDLRMIRIVYRKLGIEFEIREGGDLYVPPDQNLVIRPDILGRIPQISDAPWPQFPTDLMSIAIVVATQCQGSVIFFEKMFDGRMFFVDRLLNMGAQVILCDPHRVVVVGPSKMYGTRLESPDVRAGMAMLIASLVSEGQSEIHNIRQIDRGYERIDEKLRAIGAAIERVPVTD